MSHPHCRKIAGAFRGLFVIAPLFLSVFGAAPVRAANPPQPVTILIHKQLGAANPGTFTASGAFADSGTVTTDSFAVTAGPSPHTEVLHISQTLHGARGDVSVKMEIQVHDTTQPGVATEDGNWQVLSGTAAYATLTGGGNETAIVDHNNAQLARTLDGKGSL